jgi:hypothetical protein
MVQIDRREFLGRARRNLQADGSDLLDRNGQRGNGRGV